MYIVHMHIIIAGGFGGRSDSDDILEYDPKEDAILSVGRMVEAREGHAVSVVQVQDYSIWCQ